MSLHVTDWSFFASCLSFFPKGFCWGFNFVFTTSGFPLSLQSGSHNHLGFRMLSMFFLGGGGDARERREIPLVDLLSLCSCSLFQGRGKEPDRQVDPLERKCLSFPSLSVYCKIKKRSKKIGGRGTCMFAICRKRRLAERGFMSCLRQQRRVYLLSLVNGMCVSFLRYLLTPLFVSLSLSLSGSGSGDELDFYKSSRDQESRRECR